MGIREKLNHAFEGWIDPFRPGGEARPPDNATGFFLYFIRQAKLPFLALLVLGGLVALVEAALFYYVGRLVDILDGSQRAGGWAQLWAAHGGELVSMLVVIVLVRFFITWLAAAVEEQSIDIGFYNLVRWQSYAYVVRQSLSFFQNDFSGAIASKVWQSGGAVGDFMVALLQVAWYIAVYALTTLILLARLDWRLAVAILVWIAIFAVLARRYVPRMRRASAAAAESASALTGRIVDSYANIQTLKLFGTAETDDAFRSAGVTVFAKLVSTLTGVHVTDTSSGFRAMKAEIPQKVEQVQVQYQTSELLIGAIYAGYRIAERPITMHKRLAGESKKGHNVLYGGRYARVILSTWARERRRARQAGRQAGR